jgi:hypothetical protein
MLLSQSAWSEQLTMGGPGQEEKTPDGVYEIDRMD